MRWLSISLAAVLVVSAAGCARRDPRGAVEAAIEKHLHENPHLMLNSFTTQFQNVAINGDTANAVVKYQSKSMPKLAVHVRYTLKMDHGQWQVVSSSTDAFGRANPANPHASTTLDQAPMPQSVPGPVASH
jgi:hypothetical protein